ncbi:hypothetical protein [Nannocystis radixulma]|uniref:Outer membrane protein beta-barrel domain-containing protein n=1 Tax=Nannocystis radixulma TaxID=2995305 RepID=A0ABT5BMK6_9BACT|nr:hypothetical protein [Nannocystis radixulma]MDC0675410.1 hypothetical protein [Nannocystis radixulma]
MTSVRDRAEPPRQRAALALRAALTLAVAPRAASALPPIVWEAPAGCPDAAHVEKQMQLLVGERPAPPSDLVREVHARVEPRGDAWLLVIVFVGRAGTTERRLTLLDCQATATTTALLAAIALGDSQPVGDATSPQADASPADAAPAAPVPVTPAPLEPAPTRPVPARAPFVAPIDSAPRPAPGIARPRAYIHVGPALSLGILPHATPGLLLAFGAAWPRLRLSLGYTRWFPDNARLAPRPEIGAALSLDVATLRIGPLRRFGPLELHGGLALEVGALTATGVGSDIIHRRMTWWGATLLGGGLAFTPRALRGHGALLLQVDGVIPLHRPVLLFNRDVELFRLGAIGLRTALALEMRFR